MLDQFRHDANELTWSPKVPAKFNWKMSSTWDQWPSLFASAWKAHLEVEIDHVSNPKRLWESARCCSPSWFGVSEKLLSLRRARGSSSDRYLPSRNRAKKWLKLIDPKRVPARIAPYSFSHAMLVLLSLPRRYSDALYRAEEPPAQLRAVSIRDLIEVESVVHAQCSIPRFENSIVCSLRSGPQRRRCAP
jgi:hypothetical protein